MGTGATSAPVVVVGASLAGMAAAARLAKSGHPVVLLEARDRLGGGWASYSLDGVLVDDAPCVLGFPAPWRDLFRKSGRPLEAELSRMGVSLEPVDGARYVFGDGAELTLPSDRGLQYETLSAAFGSAAAVRWRDLVDGLDRVWQAVRPLGLESELGDRRQLKPVRKVLRPRRTVAALAQDLAEPHLAAIVRSVAYRLGSLPEQTPAWCAVELSVARTFSRWAVTSTADSAVSQLGRSSVLVEALASRLALRKVQVELETEVTGIVSQGDRVSAVLTADGRSREAAAVVCTADPWQTYGELWPVEPSRSRRRTMRRWQPALAPVVSHQVSAEPVAGLTETVVLTDQGVPTVTYRRSILGGSVRSIFDHVRAVPQRGAGLAWHGFGSWIDRPAVTSEVSGIFLAGPFSPAGSSPSPVVLSGALAAYACHTYLG